MHFPASRYSGVPAHILRRGVSPFSRLSAIFAFFFALLIPVRAQDPAEELNIASTISIDTNTTFAVELSRSDTDISTRYKATIKFQGATRDTEIRLPFIEGQATTNLLVSVESIDKKVASIALQDSIDIPKLPLGLNSGTPVKIAIHREDASEEAKYDIEIRGDRSDSFVLEPKVLVFPQGQKDATFSLTAKPSRLDSVDLRLTNADNRHDRLNLKFDIERSSLAEFENNFYLCFCKPIRFGEYLAFSPVSTNSEPVAVKNGMTIAFPNGGAVVTVDGDVISTNNVSSLYVKLLQNGLPQLAFGKDGKDIPANAVILGTPVVQSDGREVELALEKGSLKTVKVPVYKGRWHYITDGLARTLEVAFFAVILGGCLGFFVAVIRATHDKYGRLILPNALAKVYITVIRGTPMTVQLLIAYFIIFSSINNKVLVAILAFGFNSGAYVAEIIRAGIVSIDDGQMEAARSLGLSYGQGMRRIVLPQAIRNVLPALGNEFIVMLKDTSIASFIGLDDLARGGSIIRSQTYQAYIPFLAVAAIYLILVMIFSKLLTRLERHLHKTGA